MLTLALILLVCSAVPALLLAVNLPLFPRSRIHPELPPPSVSILIPARNEAENIETIVRSAFASRGVETEVIVLDDDSTDGTAAIVESIARSHPNLRLIQSDPLPEGWAGKMFACQQLGRAASHEWLLFVDADVDLSPDAVRGLVDHARTAPNQPALVSGPPRQITRTWAEKLLIPLIHFVLLGYLPFPGMRWSKSPGFAAAVGQLVLVRRDPYHALGGHGAVRSTFHDGVKLARAFRQNGHFTSLLDVTETVSCRMYRNAPEVWNGLLKNAAEGLGAPGVILPMTILLIGGQVLPWVLLPFADGQAQLHLAIAAVLGLLTRAATTLRFRQSWLGTLLHPLGVLILEVIQWTGFARKILGRQTTWKGRTSVK